MGQSGLQLARLVSRAHRACLQFVDHPAAFSYKLPEGVGHEQGAMCEPLSVGVHAVRRAAIPPGADIAVIGSGPIGGSPISRLCFSSCGCIHRSYDLPQRHASCWR